MHLDGFARELGVGALLVVFRLGGVELLDHLAHLPSVQSEAQSAQSVVYSGAVHQ